MFWIESIIFIAKIIAKILIKVESTSEVINSSKMRLKNRKKKKSTKFFILSCLVTILTSIW